MKEWEVTLPISGYVYVTVEAESAEEAIDKALCEEDFVAADIVEWSPLKEVVRGNVWCGIGSNRAEAS